MSSGSHVLAAGGGKEAEVEGEHHALRQQAAEHEQSRFPIVIKLVAAPFLHPKVRGCQHA
jgi:hypothetical protein